MMFDKAAQIICCAIIGSAVVSILIHAAALVIRAVQNAWRKRPRKKDS